MAIKQALSFAILLALLLTQAVFALHKGSATVGSQSHDWHTKLFSPLERPSATEADPQHPHPSDHQRACDALDHLLSAHGPGPSAVSCPVTAYSQPLPALAPPARLSSYQRLGPPSRGPPIDFSS